MLEFASSEPQTGSLPSPSVQQASPYTNEAASTLSHFNHFARFVRLLPA